MFNTLKKLFFHSSINVTLILRNQLSNMKMIKFESIASYFMRTTKLRANLRSTGYNIEQNYLVMTKVNVPPPYFDSFIPTISGRTKLPKFDKLWVDYA